MKKLTVLLLICTFAFSAFSQTEEEKGKVIDKIVAVVGDEILLKSEVEAQKLQLKGQKGYPTGQELHCMVVEEMLREKLLLHQARVDSLEVGEAEVDGEIERRLQYYIGMLGDQKKFEEYYGKSVAQFREDFKEPIREQLLAERMKRQIYNDVNVTPEDVTKYFNSLSKDSLPLINAKVAYSQIAIEPEVREVQKEKTRRLLDSIRTEIMKGNTSMMIQAALHSEDPGSKYKGGCYDLMQRGSFVPEYEAAVFNTDEGSYSPVFESEYGFHFVYVEEKRGEYYKACHILKRPKVTDLDIKQAKMKLDTAKQMMKDSLTFQSAASRFSSDLRSAKAGGKVMNPRTGSIMHEVDQLDRQIFFVLDKLKVGEVSEPVKIETENGDVYYAIYKLDKRVEAHRANLRDDYQMIQKAAEGEKREEVFDEWIENALMKTYDSVDQEILDKCEFSHSWGVDDVSKF
ncbi:peptidylprolyl isomerase [Halocola ammonii]